MDRETVYFVVVIVVGRYLAVTFTWEHGKYCLFFLLTELPYYFSVGLDAMRRYYIAYFIRMFTVKCTTYYTLTSNSKSNVLVDILHAATGYLLQTCYLFISHVVLFHCVCKNKTGGKKWQKTKQFFFYFVCLFNRLLLHSGVIYCATVPNGLDAVDFFPSISLSLQHIFFLFV